MAKPVVIDDQDGVTIFHLISKSLKYQDCICRMDTVDFLKYVSGTNCWYIHKSTKKGISAHYIRRTTSFKCKNEHLHRIVLNVTEEFSMESVVDHQNFDGLDNRKLNLNLTTHSVNVSRSRRTKRRSNISFMGIGIVHVRSNGRDFYQAYSGTKFIAYHKTLDGIKEKIEAKLVNNEK